MQFEEQPEVQRVLFQRMEKRKQFFQSNKSKMICCELCMIILESLVLVVNVVLCIIFGFYHPILQFIGFALILMRVLIRIATMILGKKRTDVTRSVKPTECLVLSIIADVSISCFLGYYVLKKFDTLLSIIWNFGMPLATLCPTLGYAALTTLKLIGIVLFSLFLLARYCCSSKIKDDLAGSFRLSMLESRGQEQVRVEVWGMSGIPVVDEVGEIINRLVEEKYRSSRYKEVLEECPICCLEFQDDELVTLLPCDSRHYFHQHCIKDWLSKNNSCPLCSSPVTKKYSQSILASSLKDYLRHHRNSRIIRIGS